MEPNPKRMYLSIATNLDALILEAREAPRPPAGSRHPWSGHIAYTSDSWDTVGYALVEREHQALVGVNMRVDADSAHAPTVEAFTVQTLDNTHALNASEVRGLPIGQLMDWAVMHAAGFHVVETMKRSGEYATTSHKPTPIGDVKIIRPASEPTLTTSLKASLVDAWNTAPRGRTPRDPNHYAILADAYRALQRQGSRTPALALAQVLSGSPQVMRNRLSTARKMGLLEPAKASRQPNA